MSVCAMRDWIFCKKNANFFGIILYIGHHQCDDDDDDDGMVMYQP